MNIKAITDTLVQEVGKLRFASPVAHVYNPLEYARDTWDLYAARYGHGEREIILLGMNPGPWGMVQTGVPFGDVTMVREWLEIEGKIGTPAETHPKRPVSGFSCPRREVSGTRLWGWARERFNTPKKFFSRFFVANYCPLAFMETSGRNRTPNNLPAREKEPLFMACDQALKETVRIMKPQWVLGLGKFAAGRASEALKGTPVRIGSLTHPSPANPRANRGWATVVQRE
ncbi:MAG TPA: single-stranded DNA-binding protein, partial [Desulfobacteraceae bacterium]|nr:single-stranded DNA-binding protein [Desulfobacteraceae bacterium]